MTRTLLFFACAAFISSAQKAPLIDDSEAIARFELLIKAGNLTEAQSALESYTAQRAGSWRAQYQLGYTYFRLHRIQASVASLCKSLVINDGFSEAHKILAYDLNILGDPNRAIIELERAITLDPASAESHYELGRIYYEKGSYVQAIDQLEKAKILAPDYVRLYHNLGLAYAGISDKSKAVENFEEGLSRNRQQAKPSAWPLIDYATYFNLQGDFERARTMLQEAISIDPKWDQAYDELSKAQRGLGRITEAINALQQAIALNNGKPEYHYVLAQLYKQTRRFNEAEEQLTQYRKVRSPGQAQSFPNY